MVNQYTCEPMPDRFWSKVDKTCIITDCWIWTGGSVNNSGYAYFSLNGKIKGVHVFSYELIKGKIAKDLQIDHLCKNRLCVNPDHLEAVPHRENMLRGDTIPALNARKTYCPRGHLLKGSNLLKYNLEHYGQRSCRKCFNQKRRKYNE